MFSAVIKYLSIYIKLFLLLNLPQKCKKAEIKNVYINDYHSACKQLRTKII